MTDDLVHQAPDQLPVEPVLSQADSRIQRKVLFPWLCGLGFILLAGAIIYVWQFPHLPAGAVVNASDIHQVEQRYALLDVRLSRLEQQPSAPSGADLGKIAARLDGMEARLADQPRLGGQLDALSGRIEALSGRDQTGVESIKQQFNSVTSRLSSLEKSAGDLSAISSRIDRLGRLQAAGAALAAGRPLGDIPDAPPTLSRYAHSAPPTLAQLQLTFSSAERAALSATQPSSGSGPFLDRVWERAQGLVTVRQGDDVVVGNTSAIALTRAKSALDAGDLAGAVAAAETLNTSALHPLAVWLDEAKALLAARSALTDMATHF